MKIRDRVVELRRVRAADLLPNEKNWRTHSAAQADALKDLLAEIGFAGALLAYQTPAGLKLIDGHLRAETAPETEVPVLVLDVDDAEAAKLLATVDPIGAMAGADKDRLDALLRDVDTGSAGLQAMLSQLATDVGITPPDFAPAGIDEQGRLDEKKRVTCPECGHEFVP